MVTLGIRLRLWLGLSVAVGIPTIIDIAPPAN